MTLILAAVHKLNRKSGTKFQLCECPAAARAVSGSMELETALCPSFVAFS